MRTKLLSALLLASTALTGVASASPIVRDHRYDRPAVTYRPTVEQRARPQWSAGVQVTTRPSWIPQVNYGFQLTDGNEVLPYQYGQDPYVEGIARGEWYTLDNCVELQGTGNVRVSLANRPLRSLELQATNGSADVTLIGVQFADGSHAQFNVRRDLDTQHSPNLRLDLGAQGLKGVNAITVWGSGSTSFRVLGA